MFRSIFAAVMLVSAAYYSIPAWSVQTSGSQGAESPQFNSSAERIGELRLGQPDKEVNIKIPCKPTIYDGLTFLFENGKVVNIFLGAAAE